MSGIRESLEAAAKWAGLGEVAYSRAGRCYYLVSYPGIKIMRGGSTWLGDAWGMQLLCSDVATKQAGMKLARTLAVGWRAVIVAIDKNLAVFAGGRLIGRIPNSMGSFNSPIHGKSLT